MHIFTWSLTFILGLLLLESVPLEATFYNHPVYVPVSAQSSTGSKKYIYSYATYGNYWLYKVPMQGRSTAPILVIGDTTQSTERPATKGSTNGQQGNGNGAKSAYHLTRGSPNKGSYQQPPGKGNNGAGSHSSSNKGTTFPTTSKGNNGAGSYPSTNKGNTGAGQYHSTNKGNNGGISNTSPMIVKGNNGAGTYPPTSKGNNGNTSTNKGGYNPSPTSKGKGGNGASHEAPEQVHSRGTREIGQNNYKSSFPSPAQKGTSFYPERPIERPENGEGDQQNNQDEMFNQNHENREPEEPSPRFNRDINGIEEPFDYTNEEYHPRVPLGNLIKIGGNFRRMF